MSRIFVLVFLAASLINFAFSFAANATDPPLTSVVFTPDGKSVVACSQSGIQVYSYPQLKKQKTIEVSADNLHCLAFSPNEKLLAVGGGNPSEEGIVEILSWPDGKSVAKLSEHDDSVLSVVWQDDSHLFSASLDRTIKHWDLQSKKSTHTIKGHSRGVTTLCLLQEKNLLVSSGADQSVRVWDLESFKLVRSLSQHTKPVHVMALRPLEGSLPMVASAAGDRTIRFWQPSIGRLVRYVRLDKEPLNIAWLDENRIAAVCVDGHLRIVDADEVKVVHDAAAIKGWAYAVAVHPKDHGIVVAGANGQIRKIAISPKSK